MPSPQADLAWDAVRTSVICARSITEVAVRW